MSPREEEVVSKLSEYGKLGLLVEDAPDAALRTARELYAADGLPDWWIRIDNITEATSALRKALEVAEAYGKGRERDLPLLVLFDRYLQVGGEKGASRVVSWDPGVASEPAVARELRTLVARLESLTAEGRPCILEKVTSYPEGPWALSRIDWKPRNREPLFHLRKLLLKRAPALLEYGPVMDPPLLAEDPVSTTHSFSLAGEPGALTGDRSLYASCRARLWHPSIRELAAAFHEEDHRRCARVLFTGAGASLANDRLASGIPPTWFLLEWACWSVCIKHGLLSAKDRPEPTWPAPFKERNGLRVTSIRALIDLYCSREDCSVVELEWEPLENLFNQSDQYMDDFSQAFRHILLRYDHGFPYHSWLLARLPWTLVMTTNFDGFHERATGAAVSADPAFPVGSQQRLGYLLELETREVKVKGLTKVVWKGPKTFEDLQKGPRLLKSYGSLTTMGPLTLALEDFWKSTGPMQHCLKLIREACDECWLVVVGHGLAYPAIEGALMELAQTTRCSLRALWVDPRSCQLASSSTDVSLRRRFQAAVNGEAVAATGGKPARRYDPIPARALDFAYDLWQEYEQQRREKTAVPRSPASPSS